MIVSNGNIPSIKSVLNVAATKNNITIVTVSLYTHNWITIPLPKGAMKLLNVPWFCWFSQWFHTQIV